MSTSRIFMHLFKKPLLYIGIVITISAIVSSAITIAIIDKEKRERTAFELSSFTSTLKHNNGIPSTWPVVESAIGDFSIRMPSLPAAYTTSSTKTERFTSATNMPDGSSTYAHFVASFKEDTLYATGISDTREAEIASQVHDEVREGTFRTIPAYYYLDRPEGADGFQNLFRGVIFQIGDKFYDLSIGVAVQDNNEFSSEELFNTWIETFDLIDSSTTTFDGKTIPVVVEY